MRKTCVSCWTEHEIIYRGMCQDCTREFRYARYRGWIERRALRLCKRIPGEGQRLFKKARLKVVRS